MMIFRAEEINLPKHQLSVNPMPFRIMKVLGLLSILLATPLMINIYTQS